MKRYLALFFLCFIFACSTEVEGPNTAGDPDTTTDPTTPDLDAPSNSLGVTTSANGDFSTLVWADEFDTDGRPDPNNWFHETVGPNNGSWWNNEFQHYTDREENSYVDNGSLKIVALRENYDGKLYTSARMITKDLFTFKYGRLEARAKLPVGQGTWPAIWMLGENIDIVGWPACGEVDLMEHGNKDPGIVSAAVHLPNSNGDHYYMSNELQIENEASEYHVYSVTWTPTSLEFYVDDVLFHTFVINTGMPFNKQFFIILNVAMGGQFTGNFVDPEFTSSAMEIDYIRVYQ